MRFLKELMRFLKQLMRQPEQLTRFLKQLMRFLKQLMRFLKVSTGFPEVAMRPLKFGAWNPKEAGGLGSFRQAPSLCLTFGSAGGAPSGRVHPCG
jgi:hypothetical protein